MGGGLRAGERREVQHPEKAYYGPGLRMSVVSPPRVIVASSRAARREWAEPLPRAPASRAIPLGLERHGNE